LLKSYKTEINPTNEQKQIINRTIGVSRFVYNFYLAYNKEMHEQGEKFMSGMDFSKWVNNEYLPENSDKMWLKEVYAKAVKQSILNAEQAFKRFFKGQSNFLSSRRKTGQMLKCILSRMTRKR